MPSVAQKASTKPNRGLEYKKPDMKCLVFPVLCCRVHNGAYKALYLFKELVVPINARIESAIFGSNTTLDFLRKCFLFDNNSCSPSPQKASKGR